MRRSLKAKIATTSELAQAGERLGEFILYTTPDGTTEIQLRQADGGFWLSQKEMAVLYQVSVPAISQHLRSVFESGELSSDSVIKSYLITANDGKNYKTRLYSLEAVLAVGYPSCSALDVCAWMMLRHTRNSNTIFSMLNAWLWKRMPTPLPNLKAPHKRL